MLFYLKMEPLFWKCKSLNDFRKTQLYNTSIYVDFQKCIKYSFRKHPKQFCFCRKNDILCFKTRRNLIILFLFLLPIT